MTDMSTTPETYALCISFGPRLLNEEQKREELAKHAHLLEARLIARTELLREARNYVASNAMPHLSVAWQDKDAMNLLGRIDAALSAHPQGDTDKRRKMEPEVLDLLVCANCGQQMVPAGHPCIQCGHSEAPVRNESDTTDQGER